MDLAIRRRSLRQFATATHAPCLHHRSKAIQRTSASDPPPLSLSLFLSVMSGLIS